MSEDILKDLNPSQQAAARHTSGPSIILAGAGSGKTRVLIHKVAYLIQQKLFHSEEILMITFTNKAAGEMKTRIANMSKIKGSKAQNPTRLGFVGTYHSFCARILRVSGHHIGLSSDFAIYTDDDQESLIKQIIKTMEVGKLTPGFFLAKISDAKNQLVRPEHFLDVFSFYKAAQVAQVYVEYQKLLTQHQAVDFDDLLMKTVELFRTHPEVLSSYQDQYRYVLIDEFQDTNLAQYALARMLAQTHGNITVVGDFSQAIYSWRGADIRNLERFSTDFPGATTFYLERNYRSTQSILTYAYEKIVQNQTHPILKLHTESSLGEDIVEYEAENEEQEALYVGRMITEQVQGYLGDASDPDPYSHFAVLYRTNAQSRAIEEVFLHYGLPYVLVGGTRFYARKEVRDVLSYLRLLIAPDDPVAKERIQKLGKRRWDQFMMAYPDLVNYVADSTPETLLELVLAKTKYLDLYNPDDPEDVSRLENIKELKSVASGRATLSEFFEHVALVENERSMGERKNQGKGVRLMSLHASKGLEFDSVFLVGLEEGILPHSRSLDDPLALEEERRLFYVGITRARTRLYVTWARRRGLYGRRQYSSRSRFITRPDDDMVKRDAIIDDWDIDPSVSEWQTRHNAKSKESVNEFDDIVTF